jgi:hypothetical protein
VCTVVVVVFVVVGLYENVKKNKVCQEIPGFFLSFFLFVPGRDFYFCALKTFLKSARMKQEPEVCKMILTFSNKYYSVLEFRTR